MTPAIATVACALVIGWLFVLDHERKPRPSMALWIPVAWLLINGSRPVSMWLTAAGFVEPVVLSDSPDRYLDGSPIDRFVFACLLVAGLLVISRRTRQVGALLRRNRAILLFFAYCALSVLWSDYPFVAFKRWTKAVGDLVMIVIVLTDAEPAAALRRLFARVGFLLLPLSVLFIKYYPDLGRVFHIWSWTYMYTGVTLVKNLLGVLCLVAGLGSAWRFLSAYQGAGGRVRNQRLLAHGAIVLMVLWLLWVADSMTSLACFLVGSALMAATSFRGLARKRAVVHFLVVTMVGVAFIAVFLDPGGTLVASLGRDTTLTGRTAIWQSVLPLAQRPLVGTGFESFWLGERLARIWSTMPGIQEAHNGYVEVYLNLGWIGIALLGLLLMTGYRNVMAVLRRDQVAGSIRLGLFVVAVIYSLTEAGFRMMSLTWVSLLLAITALPEAPVLEKSSSMAAQPTSDFAEGEPQAAAVLHSGPDEEAV